MKKYHLFILINIVLLNSASASFFSKKCQLSDGITIDTSSHTLTMCADNKVVSEFAIALGRGGVGKKKRNDMKTPLGLYRLSAPRKSSQFGVFIPIGYPTPQQQATGFSGSDVGIHGPVQKHTWFKFLNKTTTSVDWTFGCIAVEKNSQIEDIADYLKKHPNAQVMIS